MPTADLQPFFDDAPAAWTVALGVLTACGFVLWIAGGRLARAGVALSGFLLGGLLATTAAAELGVTANGVVAIGIAGALAGTLLAFLLFRLWVGLLAGLILAAVVPAALLLWGGPAEGPDAAATAATAATAGEPGGDAAAPAPSSLFGVFEGEAGDEPAAGRSAEERLGGAAVDAAGERLAALGVEATAALGDFFETATAAWKAQIAAARQAWDDLPAGSRRVALTGAAIGFVLGLLLGLAMPNLTAAFQTALVGACLLTAGTLLLLQRHAGLFRGGGPGAADPAGGVDAAASAPDPRALLLVVGLVTLVGLLLQWTLARRRADA
ncbi:hypothetical protein [Phycisphaera mikurensis]|uniref:Uncharacterized protein n=1 Tax=Phycisphaera mikurensis (strain NBRC 102666 / KCTC 22515 / FYK2301M01) TaxID=1142394 RepID=I0IER5_PHYMF|nr:hypothetical protein [Phycisphaera mikurensis]MBB6441548.1 hypothetical protein [Phycisphaera mikurensis]BAM03753.1 hypothetical protein PSMK_15940 [Phycisphaera mikurensis NBRC 102666]